MFQQESINTIKDKLIAKGQTVAVAESVTAGFLSAALSTAESASQFFQGGITAFNIGQKCRHMNVNPIHALSCNCVSQKMADDMAFSIAKTFTADWGISITGYATLVPESCQQLFAFFSIVCQGKVMLSKKIMVDKEQQGMPVQLEYVNHILDELATVLNKKIEK